MTNPNLAWFIACVCCFILGLIVRNTEDEADAIGFTIVFTIVCAFGDAVAYCAISYLL